eukprot:Skav205911  [mRNA]  locus=scaffold123:514949:522804:+ [translate_table: standard]
MNPPHKGHAQLLRQAKERLESAGYQVGGEQRSAGRREQLGELNGLGLVSEDPLVAVGRWESAFVKGRWPDFPEVAVELQRTLKRLVDDQLGAFPVLNLLLGESGSPRVFYACGTDHAERCGLYDGFGRFCADVGVVVVPREAEEAEAERPPHVYVAEAAPGDVSSFSSTKIRPLGGEHGVFNSGYPTFPNLAMEDPPFAAGKPRVIEE